MKNNIVKRVAALAMAAVMTMGMSASVWATDPDTGTSGVTTSEAGNGQSGSELGNIDIPVDIVVFNTASQTIYEPNVTYTFTLAPEDPNGATVTDEHGSTTTVKQGVDGGVTIVGNSGSASSSGATLVFGGDTSGDLATNHEGTAVSDSSKVSTAGDHVAKLTLAFDPSVFNAAGVYRYKIEDTTTAAALTAAGIVRSDDYEPVRYLDVYVEKADDAYRVFGCVLFKTEGGDTSIAYDPSAVTSMKVTGYDIPSEMVDGTSTADEYHTFNLKVTKTTTGSMADLNHEFPIAVTFNNSTITSQTDFYSTDDFTNASLALDANGTYSVNTNFAATPSVKNGDTFTFVGLPAGTTFLINEKNNTPDSYTVVIKDETTSADLFASAIVASGNDTDLTTATALGNLSGSTYETENIQITNTLNAISPTGYVTRFAPYALMLAGAIVLLMFMRRRREDSHTDMI